MQKLDGLPGQSEIRPISTLSDYQPSSSRRSRVCSESQEILGGQRRSRQAKRRVERMRATYQEERETAESARKQEDPWEQEAEDLYQWTQKLSFDDIR